jgi:wyosine [tRNA(Phe)-imidazoG37] synthetase (radical SAM superfamily)
VDYVSIKIDTVSEKNWNKINRPHNSLNFRKILTGLYKFSKNFHGKFVTETMIIKNINDNSQEFESIADFIDKLNSNKNYISIPTRPTAEKSCTPADEFDINMAYQIFKEKDLNVEFLTRYEDNTFVFTGNVEQDLLSITSVHPMREEGINNFLSRSEEDWNIIKKLIKENKLIEVKYKNKKFYMRKIPKKN